MKKSITFQWPLYFLLLFLTMQGYAQPRINEIHYDDTGGDANERVEIAAPAGTDLTGWSLLFYNGSDGTSYGTIALSGIIPSQCMTDVNGGTLTFVVVPPLGSFQNGAPDGLALINAGVCVEFLSYEGSFMATNGVCNGMTSTDIGAFEPGTAGTDENGSIQKNAGGTWTTAPTTNTFSACNTSQADFTVVLPVELLRFDATVVQRTVELNWHTAAERNNDRFEIERSTNGRDFSTLQTIKGAGSSSTEQRYTYVDQRPVAGTNYYRLRQIDLDGKTTALRVVSAEFGQPRNKAVFSPNPSTGLTRLTYTTETEGSLTLTVRDLSGRTIMQQAREVAKGENQLTFDCSALAKGTYLVELATSDDTQVQKLIIH